MSNLQVSLRLYNRNDRDIGEVFPQSDTCRLSEGKTWGYQFGYMFNPQIHYYRIFTQFKRKGKSQIIRTFQGSKHYLTMLSE